ncbi:DUF262 domain-containing protein [candidate division WOR-3 bacterium]|jgi:uncharacterized protein with ParB-like and HNH nuclease domain|nr:DUF262 domain-containing protein [candidate division WOR-3 bacterium]
MAKNFEIKSYSINDYRQWHERGELILSPKFQRRRVWSAKAKSYLIDTILRELPIPPVFIRETIDLKTRKSIREVIDGQQRLATILDYLKDGFSVSKIHNQDYGGLYFSQLPDEVQKEFLLYNISTNKVLISEDKDVLGIFARLNTYTVPLNKTELLNAKYFGLFKQTVHSMAHEFYTFWIKSKILKEPKIARMADVELTSELIIASIDGIQDRRVIETYYKRYDDRFDNKDKITDNFKKCMDTIGEIYGDILPDSYFNKSPLFYSLYCMIYDLLFGLPNSENTLRIEPSQYPKIKIALESLEAILEESSNKSAQDSEPDIKQFIDDYTRHTTVEAVRNRRHQFLLAFIIKYL